MQRKQEKFLHAYKAARFVDRKDIKKIIPHFMQRNYGMSLVWMIAAFLCGGSATYALLYMTSNMALIGLVFCSIFCCLAVFCVINVKHSRDLLMATEFQNAIFSAAARIDCKFSLIIDAEGRTLYMDSAFQHIFSRELTLGYEGIKALLAHEGLRENEKALVAEAIEKKQSFTVPFYMKEDEKEVSFSLFVDPLDRPVGFSFIRCMNYNNDAKEKRVSSVTPSPHASAQNNLTTLIAEKEWEHLLDMAPVAVALLTKEGEVLWSNQAFLTLASEEKPSGWNVHQ